MSDDAGKGLHHAIANKVHAAANSLRYGQCGCRPGRGFDLASHTVRLFAARAKRLGLVWAALFTDVVAASIRPLSPVLHWSFAFG